MRYTQNIKLPIVEDNDLYSKEINNLAFEKIDEEIQGLADIVEMLDSPENSIADVKKDINDIKSDVVAINEQLDNKANLHDSFFRYGMVRPTVNMGDSISEGSNSLDYVNDSWCGLLNKAYQRKYNVRNQGFVNFNTYVVENNDNINTFHKIKRTGFNVHESPFEGSVYGGTRITSVTADEYVEITYTGKDFYVVYTQDSTGAILDVQVDNNKVGEIDTKVLNGIKNGSVSPRVPVEQYGSHTIKLINKGGTAQLCGIIYVENSEEFSPVFYNLGRSSLTLSELPDDLLEFYASYGTVIFSLGVNDQLLSKDIETFGRKLHTIFSKIKESSGNCIINDFMFSLPNDNPYKKSLKEIGENYGFEVINYADLMLGALEENKFLKYLDDDGVHLTTEGHEFVYNIISNKLGLPYTKSDLNKVLTINTPLLKNSWTNFVNDNSHRNACYYKKDNLVYLEGMIKGGISTSYTELFTLAPEFKPSNDIYFPVACSGETGQITITKEGVVKIVSGNNSWLSLNGIAYYV